MPKADLCNGWATTVGHHMEGITPIRCLSKFVLASLSAALMLPFLQVVTRVLGAGVW